MAGGVIKMCVDCNVVPARSRGRCQPCYRALIKILKASGDYAPRLNSQNLVSRLWGRAVAGRNGCLIWTGTTSRSGYGKIRHANRFTATHRLAYELIIGSIPDGMQLDHLCHTRDTTCLGGIDCPHRRCMNPYHMEPVSPKENTFRTSNSPTGANAKKTRCAQGHPYDSANTRIRPNGGRACRACERANVLRQRQAASRTAPPAMRTTKKNGPSTGTPLPGQGLTTRIF